MPSNTQPIILAVDDAEPNLDILVETLGDEFDVAVAMDGESALEMAAELLPDIILLDIMMPGMDGYEVCERLKKSGITRGIPVIFVTAMAEENDEARGLELGAVDYITKPFIPDLIRARVRNHIELKRHRDHLEELVYERTRELANTQDATIESMGRLAECRDPETGEHIRRTRAYMRLLAEGLAQNPEYTAVLDAKTIDLLCKSAPLHDIGKVGIPDSILLKPGKLTPAEFEVMKGHPMLGKQAIAAAEKKLGSNSFLRLARDIAMSHHEKWDGSGYPLGLKGADIPLCGRLMAVADVYDALISRRVYKEPMMHSAAVAVIQADAGSAFDPAVVTVFLDQQENFRTIALENTDCEEVRAALQQ